MSLISSVPSYGCEALVVSVADPIRNVS